MKFINIPDYYEYDNNGLLTDSCMRIIAKYITEQTSLDEICRYYAKIPIKCTELELENIKIGYQARIYSWIKKNEETIMELNSIMLNHYEDGADDWLILLWDTRRGRSDEELANAVLEYLNRTNKRTYETL